MGAEVRGQSHHEKVVPGTKRYVWFKYVQSFVSHRNLNTGEGVPTHPPPYPLVYDLMFAKVKTSLKQN